MAHMLSPTSHPDILIMKIIGSLNYDDMTCDSKLRLNERPMWIILDVSSMTISLPSNFLNGAMKSWFTNPNTQHLALVTSSGFLKSIGLLVAKVTRRKERLSLHESVAAAEQFLLNKIAAKEAKEAGHDTNAGAGGPTGNDAAMHF